MKAEKIISRQQRWRNAHPFAAWAHSATRSAVRRGLITPRSCEECGEDKSEAHHPDHRNPLQVKWLCRPCHKREHVRLKQEADNVESL